MAGISYNVSYYLTSDGVKRVFQKLFDLNTTYNRAFFSNKTTLLKLRAYTDDTHYITSTSEDFFVEDNHLRFIYMFDVPNLGNIVSLKIYDGSVCTMNFNNMSLIEGDPRTSNYIELYFTVNQVTKCIPKTSLPLLAQSLANYNNQKINRIFIGTGEPDLSGNSNNLTNFLTSYMIQFKWYLDNKSVRLEATANDDIFVKNNITELGIGWYKGGTLDDLAVTTDCGGLIMDTVGYTLCTLQNTRFVNMVRKGKYKIQTTIYLV